MSNRALVYVFSVILFSVPMFAQTQGGISGVIRDASSAVVLPSIDALQEFNTGAFVLQPFGTHGNAGRNTIITAGLMQWDFSVHKEFRIAENHAVQFRFEAFNFLNHPNWGNPDVTIISPSFGKIRTTRTNMREIAGGAEVHVLMSEPQARAFMKV